MIIYGQGPMLQGGSIKNVEATRGKNPHGGSGHIPANGLWHSSLEVGVTPKAVLTWSAFKNLAMPRLHHIPIKLTFLRQRPTLIRFSGRIKMPSLIFSQESSGFRFIKSSQLLGLDGTFSSELNLLQTDSPSHPNLRKILQYRPNMTFHCLFSF